MKQGSASNLRPWRLAGLLCLLVLVADQVAKALVEANLYPGEQIELVGPLALTLAHNRGVAFGLAAGGGAALIAFTALSLCFIAWLFSREPQRRWLWIAVGLLVGGALGNLVDRVRHGQVTDYIDILSWPPFNIADIAISCGVALLVLTYLLEPGTADESDA